MSFLTKKRAKTEKEKKNDQTGTQTNCPEYSRLPVLLSTGNGAFFILGTHLNANLLWYLTHKKVLRCRSVYV